MILKTKVLTKAEIVKVCRTQGIRWYYNRMRHRITIRQGGGYYMVADIIDRHHAFVSYCYTEIPSTQGRGKAKVKWEAA